METEPVNFARIELKKSSSTGKIGYNISIQAAEGVNEEVLKDCTEKAIKTALKAQLMLGI